MKAIFIEPGKILLFISDVPLANNITTCLKEAGYQVSTASKGLVLLMQSNWKNLY